MQETDALPLFQQLTQPASFEVPGTQIQATLQPQILERADMLVLKMMQDNPNRPIYFSNTAVGYPAKLGVERYMLMQGLARKLLPVTPTASPDTMPVPSRGMYDVQRSRALWSDVFVGDDALIAKGSWTDRPSVGIPYLYVDAGLTLAETLNYKGDTVAAQRVYQQAYHVAQSTGIVSEFAIPSSLPSAEPAIPVPSITPADSTAGAPAPAPPPR